MSHKHCGNKQYGLYSTVNYQYMASVSRCPKHILLKNLEGLYDMDPSENSFICEAIQV